MNFSEQLIEWYQENKRDLPWRGIENPYFIWLSEIILQQTRVVQGWDYYLKFTNQYPDIKLLAAAPEDEVLKLWQGLGYYSRARNLHHTAQQVVERFGGVFPSKYEDIRSLKGIGKYTAAAIASFAFGQAYAVVDGNVYRLLSRFFGIQTPIDTGTGEKEFAQLAEELLNKNQAAIYNQAIMEFGAIQCVPKSPNCSICPLLTACYAYRNQMVEILPIKSKKTKQRNRYFNYLVINQGSTTYLQKRRQKDIWQNLYEFPLIESDKSLSINELMQTQEWKIIFENAELTLQDQSQEYVHQLSHQRIFCKFYSITTNSVLSSLELQIRTEELQTYAVPQLIANYLNSRDLKAPVNLFDSLEIKL